MKEKKIKKSILGAVVLAVLLMICCYYLGYQNGKSSVTPSGQFAGAGAKFARNNSVGMVNGSVLSMDNSSITVKMRDGSTKIVLYSPSTLVLKSTTGTTSDVSTGSQVMVQGKTNSDGSVTANTIQIRPDMSQTQGMQGSSQNQGQ